MAEGSANTKEVSDKTNVQLCSEKARGVYCREGVPTVLEQALQVYEITYREFAEIFGISLGHAQNIIKHRTFPALELAVAIARYFEVTVEDLFAWRVDDDGKRCPLMRIDPATGKAHRVSTKHGDDNRRTTMDLIRERYGRV